MSSVTYSLWGTIRVVTDPKEDADFRVKVITSPTDAADLYVKVVKTGPFTCGVWRFVFDKTADNINFSVRFVSEDEHFTIKFDDATPGSSY
jgi:hypothetical protein